MGGTIRPASAVVAGCDTLVALGEATLRGSVLFAKNSDRPPGECQPLAVVPRAAHPAGAEVRCQYVSIPQVRDTALVLGSRPVWLWGFEHGLNEHGVAIGNETVFAREAPAATGLLGMDLVRLGLERSTTARQALEVVTGLIEEHGQGGSGFRDMDWPYNNGFLIADPGEAWILETAGRQWAARPAVATDAISNQISIGTDWQRLSRGAIERAASAGLGGGDPFDFSAAYRDRDGVPAEFSEGRLRRSRSLLAAGRGRLTAAEMREILRDHHGAGRCFAAGASPDQEAFYTLCMHQGPSRTAASIVAELEPSPRGPRSAWVSFGRPCASAFFPVYLTGELPEALARGSDEPSDALWWQFERLAACAESDPQAAERIRGALDELESAFAARDAEVRESLGGPGDAQIVRGFMEEIVAQLQSTARELVARCG
jgi:dipeptidase